MLGRIGRLAATVFGAAAVVVVAMVIADVWRHGLPDISVASLLRILRGGEPGPAIERSMAASAVAAPAAASIASTSEPLPPPAVASQTAAAETSPTENPPQVPGPLRAAANAAAGDARTVSEPAPAAEPPPVPFPALANVAVSSAPGTGPAQAHGGRARQGAAASPVSGAPSPVLATAPPVAVAKTGSAPATGRAAGPGTSATVDARPSPPQPPLPAPSPSPAPTASPVAAVRDVTAPGMTRLVQPTGPLVRIDPPKGANAAATDEVAPTKHRDPEVPQVLRLAIVEDGVTLRSGALRVKLAGLRPIDTDQTCRTAAGVEWPCGRQATVALRMLMRGRSPACVLADGIKGGTTIGLCRLGAQDVSEWMVRQGWAYAATPDLAEAEAEAREHKRGAFALDVPAIAPQTSAGVVAPMPGLPLEGVAEQPWAPAPALASRDAAIAPKPTGTP